MRKLRHRSATLLACLLSFAAISTPLVSKAASRSQGFRLLPVTATVTGKSRAELVVLAYSTKVLAKKEQIETKDCGARPQFGTTAEGTALAKLVFSLPAQLGKTMSCTMPSSSMLIIRSPSTKTSPLGSMRIGGSADRRPFR